MDELGSEVPRWPVTIMRSRYGGIYEPGVWIAFDQAPADIPDGWRGDDAACAACFDERRGLIGGGDTPDAALEDLVRRRHGR
jgi:hypothetical protein